MSNRFYVLTGGPGSGKTSVIEELARQGFATMPEAGRGIIREQMEAGGTALPWADQARFADAMLDWELRNHKEAGHLAGPVFFDRGLPDIVGYLDLCGLAVPERLHAAVDQLRYNPVVFAFPFWSEIFTQDAERKQSPDEAERTFHAVTASYRSFGYTLTTMPRLTIRDRASFILRSLDLS